MSRRHALPNDARGEGVNDDADACRLQFMGLRENASSRKLQKHPGAITVFFIVHGKGPIDGATRGRPGVAPG